VEAVLSSSRSRQVNKVQQMERIGGQLPRGRGEGGGCPLILQD